MNQNNDTLKSVLFLAILGYFSVDSIMILVSHGWPFGMIQWILFVIMLKKIYDDAIKGKAVKERKNEDETEEESKI